MPTPTVRGPVLLLLGVGILLLLVGVTGIFAGLVLADRIYALLPPITADAAAIGGAALALGAALGLAGAVHVALSVLLRRDAPTPREGLLVIGIVVCVMAGALAAGWSLAAFVSAASGSAPAGGMLPAGIGLGVMACAYAWATAVLMRLRTGSRRAPRPPD